MNKKFKVGVLALAVFAVAASIILVSRNSKENKQIDKTSETIEQANEDGVCGCLSRKPICYGTGERSQEFVCCDNLNYVCKTKRGTGEPYCYRPIRNNTPGLDKSVLFDAASESENKGNRFFCNGREGSRLAYMKICCGRNTSCGWASSGYPICQTSCGVGPYKGKTEQCWGRNKLAGIFTCCMENERCSFEDDSDRPSCLVIENPQESQRVGFLSLAYIPRNPQNQDRVDPSTGYRMTVSELESKIDLADRELEKALEQGSTYHGYKDNQAKPYLDYFREDRIIKYEDFPHHLNTTYPDYNRILHEIDICDYVDNRGVKEVWLWGYHNSRTTPVESKMSSRYGDIANDVAPEVPMPPCAKAYTLYNYAYGDIANSLEDHTHQLEAIFYYVDGEMYDHRFTGGYYEFQPNNANSPRHCGWTHCPPNVILDKRYISQREQEDAYREFRSTHHGIYEDPEGAFVADWNNQHCFNSSEPRCACDEIKERQEGGGFNYALCEERRNQNTSICQGYNWYREAKVLSDCQNWKPDGTGEKELIGCETWKDVYINPQRQIVERRCVDDGGAAFKVWWMQNLPGRNNGLNLNGKRIRNFWEFIGDFDEAVEKGRSMLES